MVTVKYFRKPPIMDPNKGGKARRAVAMFVNKITGRYGMRARIVD